LSIAKKEAGADSGEEGKGEVYWNTRKKTGEKGKNGPRAETVRGSRNNQAVRTPA